MDISFVLLHVFWLSMLTINAACLGMEINSSTVCPPPCACSGNSSIDCKGVGFQHWSDICKHVNSFISEGNVNVLKDLYLEGLSPNITLPFDCIPPLRSLHVSSSKLYAIPSTLKDLEVKQALSLSQNEIQLLPDYIFSSLGSIHALNLSHNNISVVGRNNFFGLYSLQSLDLSYNDIMTVRPSSFEFLTNLTYLNLGHNRIKHFTSWDLPSSASLQVLILKENMLKLFYIGENESDSVSLNNVQSVDISHNPLECSCILQKMLHKIVAQGGIMNDVKHTLCHSPSPLRNLSVDQLNETALVCSHPHSLISFPSKRKSVLYSDTITLECRAEAFPSPHIMWVTPWGEKFSMAPMSLIVHKGLASEEHINHFREYEEKIVTMTSSIEVTEKNDLIISNFRGSLAGNFSCVAFNEVGSKQEVILLTIHSMIKSTYLTSLKFASYSASGCLIIGFLVAFITIVVRKVRQGVFFKVPLFTPAVSVRPTSEEKCPSSIFQDFSPPTSPLLGCESDRSTLSLNLSYDGESSEKRPHHILDSIGGAKERLRDGVGRKMESVRKNVQSIKESTGAYVHTIMESGSSAANKMKAGVVMGVESVKYQLQSVKELCGTGNMGAQTMSIISMETDIDTNERKSIVRQITYV